MQYFVIAPDGQKYGPADIATLNQWAVEARLTPTTELEDAATGARLTASNVPGIVFPGGGGAPGFQQPQQPQAPMPQQPYQAPQQPQQPYQQPQQPQQPYQQPGGYQQPQQGGYQQPQGPYTQPPGSNYPRPGFAGDDGSGDLTKAWIFGAIGFICCPIIFSVLGIYFAAQAKNKGNPTGQTAMIFCIVSLVVGIGLGIVLNLSRFANF